MPRTFEDHLDPKSDTKRILSIDGGGLRGVLSLEFLEVIESELRMRSRIGDRFRLSDYFDLIGGTSTGSIIAAALACGMTVGEVKTLYASLGPTVFKRPSFLHNGVLAPKFSGEDVLGALNKSLGSQTALGSPQVLTGLMVMTKRLDTGSAWPIHNSPYSPYVDQNRALLLSQVVRASTAAPTYFEPETLTIQSRSGVPTIGTFVDGGVSPFNDPALQLLALASLQGYGFRWKPGADRILLISVGTGRYHEVFDSARLEAMVPAEQGLRSLQSLMDDCARTNHMMLQWLTRCLTPWIIDREVGDMKLDSASGPALATYARYDVLLNDGWLRDNLGLEWSRNQIQEASAMDNPDHIPMLAELGRIAAAKQFIASAHLPSSFDIPPVT